MLCITYYNFTIDEEGTETSLDLVQNFTSLIIIIEIDNLLLGYFHLQFEDLDLKQFIKDEELHVKFDRYLSF